MRKHVRWGEHATRSTQWRSTTTWLTRPFVTRSPVCVCVCVCVLSVSDIWEFLPGFLDAGNRPDMACLVRSWDWRVWGRVREWRVWGRFLTNPDREVVIYREFLFFSFLEDLAFSTWSTLSMQVFPLSEKKKLFSDSLAGMGLLGGRVDRRYVWWWDTMHDDVTLWMMMWHGDRRV